MCQPSPLARGESLSAWMIISSGWPGCVRRRRVEVQLAELAAEIEVLLLRQVLVAEEDHQVLGERAVDLVHLRLPIGCDRSTPPISRADDRRQLVDRDRLIGRPLIGEMLDAGSAPITKQGHGWPPSNTDTLSFRARPGNPVVRAMAPLIKRPSGVRAGKFVLDPEFLTLQIGDRGMIGQRTGSFLVERAFERRVLLLERPDAIGL